MNNSEMITEFHDTFKVERMLDVRSVPAVDLEDYFNGMREQLEEEGNETMQALQGIITIRSNEDINALRASTYGDTVNEEDLLQDDALKAAKVAVLDGLGDMVYVIYNMADKLGLNLEEAMKRIHASNMTKLDKDGKPIYWEVGNKYGQPAGKIRKSDEFVAPVLDDLV